MESPAMYPPRQDPITNQDINRLITQQDPNLSQIKTKYPPELKTII